MTEGVLAYLVNESAGVFRYDDEYNLTMELALDVSDHYPVHFTLQGRYSHSHTLYTLYTFSTSTHTQARTPTHVHILYALTYTLLLLPPPPHTHTHTLIGNGDKMTTGLLSLITLCAFITKLLV